MKQHRPDLAPTLPAMNQSGADALLSAQAGHRVRVQVLSQHGAHELVGRVPHARELSDSPAGRVYGAACVLTRPGSLDPANPMSPQAHYLRLGDEGWRLIRLRLQDTEPLDERRLGPELRLTVEVLE